jgi:hypothetical protein
MKLFTKIKIFLILLCLINPYEIISLTTNNPFAAPSSSTFAPSGSAPRLVTPTLSETKASKYLFMYKYPALKNEPDHKLNSFNYKNIMFTSDQIVIFASSNDNDVVILY